MIAQVKMANDQAVKCLRRVAILLICSTLPIAAPSLIASAQATSNSVSQASKAAPYIPDCPETDPYVDADNEAQAAVKPPDENQPSASDLTILSHAADTAVDLADKIFECSALFHERARLESQGTSLERDMYKAAWLEGLSARKRMIAIDLYAMAIAEGNKLNISMSKHDYYERALAAQGCLGYGEAQMAQSWPLQRSRANDDFLRDTSVVELEIKGMIDKYAPDRAAAIYENLATSE